MPREQGQNLGWAQTPGAVNSDKRRSTLEGSDGGSDFESNFTSNFESISNVDREPLNGGERKSNWRDARLVPRLEDGAD